MAFQPLSPELRQRALQIAGSYNGNNTAPMKQAASALEKAGRKGDTELVHVTPGELSLLETIGAGTTNPVTGLREFYDDGTDAGDAADTSGADAPGPEGTDAGDAADTSEGPTGDGAGRDAGRAGPAAGDPGRGDDGMGPEGTDFGDVADTSGATGAMPAGPEGTDLGDAASIAAGAAAVSPPDPDQEGGIVGAIKGALDRNKDNKISAGEAALGIAAVATPLGPVMGLAKGLGNLATGIQFGTTPGSQQTSMIADQQTGLFGPDEEDGGDSDRERSEDVAAVQTPEELTVEALTRPPTIDIVPFRPEDFYYFRPGNFAYNRGIPSMMNMRRG